MQPFENEMHLSYTDFKHNDYEKQTFKGKT